MFEAGSRVTGNVLVSVDGEFAAEKVTLRLKGFERAQYEDPNPLKLSAVQGAEAKTAALKKTSEVIIDLEYTLAEFGPEDPPVKGFHKFPFDLHIPAHLPGSVMVQEGVNNLSVTYYLSAQMAPVSAELFADAERINSLLRTERAIFIHK